MSNFKKYMVTAMLAFGAFSLVAADAEARRMGGGGSIGRQSNNVSRQQMAPQQNNMQRPAQQPTAAPATAGAAGAAATAARPSAWKGIAGGLLGGLAIGALLSHLGMGGLLGGLGGMLMSLLTIALIVMAGMFLFRMIRGKNQPQPRVAAVGAGQGGFQGYNPGNAQPSNAYARTDSGLNPGGTPEIGSRVGSMGAQTGSFAAANAAPWGVPAGFDTNAFLRSAKSYFIRLQAAWDKADVNDIREFTTPEMFAEIRMQLTERGASPNHTDVVTIDAELLGMETVGDDYLASVKFSGMIREAADALGEPFAEVWNLSKPVNGNGGWVLAGIQQLN